MATDTLVALNVRAKLTTDAVQILDDLGEYISKAAALHRAAMNTGADEREDQAWLVSLAQDEVEKCERRYRELYDVPAQGQPS
jgi:hypothetical protein